MLSLVCFDGVFFNIPCNFLDLVSNQEKIKNKEVRDRTDAKTFKFANRKDYLRQYEEMRQSLDRKSLVFALFQDDQIAKSISDLDVEISKLKNE